MGRSTRADEDKHTVQRWEVLRKKAEYRRDYERVKARRGVTHDSGVLLAPLRSKAQREYERTCARWGLHILVDPELSAPEARVLDSPVFKDYPARQRAVHDGAAFRRFARQLSDTRGNLNRAIAAQFKWRKVPPTGFRLPTTARDPRAVGPKGHIPWSILAECLAAWAMLNPVTRPTRRKRGDLIRDLSKRQDISVRQVRRRARAAEFFLGVTALAPDGVRDHLQVCETCQKGKLCALVERQIPSAHTSRLRGRRRGLEDLSEEDVAF
jgi:hypothetical protein